MIRRERLAAGLSQRALAKRLWGSEIRRRTIIGWESGEHVPNSLHLDLLAEALGVPRDRFPWAPHFDRLGLFRGAQDGLRAAIAHELAAQLEPLWAELSRLREEVGGLRLGRRR